MSTENNPLQNPYDTPFSFTSWLNDWSKKIALVVKAQYKCKKCTYMNHLHYKSANKSPAYGIPDRHRAGTKLAVYCSR